MGADITYNPRCLSFEYRNDFEFKLVISGKNVLGGENNRMGVKKLHDAFSSF